MPGPRRHTLAEAKQHGPQAVSDHRRLYGTTPSAGDLTTGEVGPPPAFLDSTGQAAWQRVIGTAPPGLLRACDSDLVAALAAAIARHERAVMMSQTAWEKRPDADPALFFNIERYVRQTARQVSELAASLGLSPPARSRLAVPYPPLVESEEVPRFQKFDTLLPDGKVVRYRAPSGSRKTRLRS